MLEDVNMTCSGAGLDVPSSGRFFANYYVPKPTPLFPPFIAWVAEVRRTGRHQGAAIRGVLDLDLPVAWPQLCPNASAARLAFQQVRETMFTAVIVFWGYR